MIKLSEIINNEGIRYTDNNKGGFEIDFVQDDIRKDLILLNPMSNLFYASHTTPQLLIYSPLSFNNESIFFKEKNDRLKNKTELMRAIKSLDRNLINIDKLTKIIDISIDQFDSLSQSKTRAGRRALKYLGGQKLGEVSNVIVSLPSKSQLNNLIVERIQHKYDNIISFGKFTKLLTSEIKLDMDKIENEQWARKNKERLIKYFTGVQSRHKDKPFEVKFYNRNFRRYIQNFLTFEGDNTKEVFSSLVNNTLMLVDDTVGEGKTLQEAVNVLKMGEVVPERVFCYALIRET